MFLFKQKEATLTMTIWTRERHKPAFSLHLIWCRWNTPLFTLQQPINGCRLYCCCSVVWTTWRYLSLSVIYKNSKVKFSLLWSSNSPVWKLLIIQCFMPGDKNIYPQTDFVDDYRTNLCSMSTWEINVNSSLAAEKARQCVTATARTDKVRERTAMPDDHPDS